MPYIIEGYPILERIVAQGGALDAGAVKWMDRWRGLNLEDAARYQFPELSGSTSVNLKIQTTEAPPKSRGTFVTTNSATNPNTEIAYFNLLSIFGLGGLCRPAARYELGAGASARFRTLLQTTPINGTQRRANRDRILGAIDTGAPLLGAVKAKKPDSLAVLDSIARTGAPHNGAPETTHPVIRALQAGNPKPAAGAQLNLGQGYAGDALVLAREYSVLMTMDALFEQWDRYSGGNVTICRDDLGSAHFYTSDNGGAGLSGTGTWLGRNLAWFSRYDRALIERLGELHSFLTGATGQYLGYGDRFAFLSDLGLYFSLTPQIYLDRLVRNIGRLLDRVRAVEDDSGASAYFD